MNENRAERRESELDEANVRILRDVLRLPGVPIVILPLSRTDVLGDWPKRRTC